MRTIRKTTTHTVFVKGTSVAFEMSHDLGSDTYLVTAPGVIAFYVQGDNVSYALNAARDALNSVYAEPYHELQEGS